jgi:DNA-binding CsgD family transcriptional regulator
MRYCFLKIVGLKTQNYQIYLEDFIKNSYLTKTYCKIKLIQIRIKRDNFMIQEWDKLDLDDKFKRANELVAKIANDFANGPDNNICILTSVLINAIENLFHYINDPQDENINWENPAVDLHYNVDLDENLYLTYLRIDKKDVRNKESFKKKLISIFVNLHNILLFESLCKGTIIINQNDNYNYLIKSKEVDNEIAHINSQDDKLNKIIELTHNVLDIPFELSKFNEEKSLVQKIACNLVIEFTPLIVDIEQHTGHYSIITSLISDQNLNNFSVEEKNAIKENLIKSIRENTSNNKSTRELENFFEMGFTGKLLIDKSLKPIFIGGDTMQICANKLPAYEKPPKKLIFNKPCVKLTEEEEKILYLYVIEGIKNYREIAKLIPCSEQTVKNKAQNIQIKLGATNMANAGYLYYMPPMQDLA